MAQEIESSGEPQEPIVLLKPKKRRRKKEKAAFDSTAWMVTFSDLITLMMTFFVLLFSFNSPNPKTVEAISSSGVGLFSKAQSAVSQPVAIQNANSLVRENLEVFLSENEVQNVAISETEEGLIITLPTDIVFEKNSAQLTEKAQQNIATITRYLRKTQQDIRVEGHTDNAFQPTRRYRDAWNLSLARGYAILKEMLNTGIAPKRMSLVGKGASQPKLSNATAQGRAANRRAEIVVLNPN